MMIEVQFENFDPIIKISDLKKEKLIKQRQLEQKQQPQIKSQILVHFSIWHFMQPKFQKEIEM